MDERRIARTKRIEAWKDFSAIVGKVLTGIPIFIAIGINVLTGNADLDDIPAVEAQKRIAEMPSGLFNTEITLIAAGFAIGALSLLSYIIASVACWIYSKRD